MHHAELSLELFVVTIYKIAKKNIGVRKRVYTLKK